MATRVEVSSPKQMSARKEGVSSGTSSGGYGPGQAPAWEDFSKCIRCGLCLNACPTYRELGVEMDSPRGRIYQMVQVERGRLPLDQSFVRHMDSCLGCLACETACPSGVEYHKLIEAARSQIERFYKRSPMTGLLRRLFLQGLTSPVFLKTAGLMLRWVQRLGIEAVMRRTAKLFSRRLYNITRLAPRMDRRFFFEQLGTMAPAEGEPRYRVAFFAGCITNLSFSELNEATVRVLARNGCEVVIPKDQVCCGALHVHSGVPDTARSLGRRNFKAFAELVDGEKLDAIITNAAGCGSVLKEYPELFAEEKDLPAATKFSSRVRDVTEFLAEIGLSRKPGPVAVRATYQDPCHLGHAQRIRSAPRRLLREVPGLELIELKESDICCGSAGIYNVVQNDMAENLLAAKMDRVDETGAELVLTANPGCMLQLKAGVADSARPGRRVLHVVELLDEAYRKAEISNSESR